jgi:hypothetical protein
MPVISKRFLTIVLVVIISLPACKEKENNEPAGQEPMNFPGILFRDELGNPLGIFGGQDDNDWDRDVTWPQEIHALMSFPDTLDMSETYLDSSFVPGIDLIPFALFPNPVGLIGNINALLPGQLKIKLLIIDQYAKPVFKHAFIDNESTWLTIKMDDGSVFVEGEVYRLYYSLSVEGNPDFYLGHGDILICSDRPQNLCEHYLDP